MKITFYCHRYLPFAGGVETSTTHLVEYLVRQGHEVVVVTTTSEGAAGYPPCRMVHSASVFDIRREFHAADTIHFQGFASAPMLLAVLSGRPLVWGHHDYDLVCPKSIAWWGGWCTFGFLKCVRDLKRDHPLVQVLGLPVTLGLRRLMRNHPRMAHLVPSEAIRRDNGPRDATVLPYGLALRATGGPSAALVSGPSTIPCATFLYVGRLIPEKGVQILLDAAEILMRKGLEFTVQIVGDGPARVFLERLATIRGVDAYVRFLGQRPGIEVQTLMRGASAVVIPSIWNDSYPMVALEAMAAGAIVVASRAGGLEESVGKGGLLFERGRADELAAILEHVVKDERLRDEVRERANVVAADHAWARLGPRYEAFYATVLERTGPRRANRRATPGRDHESL